MDEVVSFGDGRHGVQRMPASRCVASGQQFLPVSQLGAGRLVADRQSTERLAGAENAVAEHDQLHADAGQRQVATNGRRLAAVQVEHERLVPRRARRRLLRRRSLLLQLLAAARHLHPHEWICSQTERERHVNISATSKDLAHEVNTNAKDFRLVLKDA